MRTYLILAAVIIAALLAACQGLSSNQALLNAQNGFEQLSSEKGAAAAFGQYAADDAVFLPTGGERIEGRAAIENAFEQSAPLAIHWSADQVRAAETSTSGSVWGTYTAAATDSDGNRVGYGKFLAVWQKRDGGWRIIAFMTNASPGPGA